LALEEYAHFTSPIRRYPDLLVHRALKAALLPKAASGRKYSQAELQALGAETSQRERRADEASRDVMGYLKCLYLEPRVGEEFEATISSALEFGLFVQLKEAPIDGLVHISAIPGDYWELENGGMGLVGQRTGRRWQMGDTVRVRLNRVDLTQRQIDFELLDPESAASHGTVRAPRLGGVHSRSRGGGGDSGRGGRGGGGRQGGSAQGGGRQSGGGGQGGSAQGGGRHGGGGGQGDSARGGGRQGGGSGAAQGSGSGASGGGSSGSSGSRRTSAGGGSGGGRGGSRRGGRGGRG
jgi:ribonuclease R